MRIKAFCEAIGKTDQAGQIPSSPGVYVILNKVTMRAYIGKSNDMVTRFKQHKSDLNGRRHHNKNLQQEWDKYGDSCFKFEVFSAIEGIDIDSLEKELIEESIGPYCYNWLIPSGHASPIKSPEQAMWRLSMFIADEQLERLRELAKSTGLGVAEHVRRAIDAYLKGKK